jgi:branched-chain amino acid transport system ATP-binding protein
MNGEPILKGAGLSRSFGGIRAVADFSFELRRGEILGLIGPNGAGKSTLFNLISGFFRPHAGRLWLKGVDIAGRSPAHVSRMGLVRTFQHESLLKDMTVYDNLSIGAAMSVWNGKARDQRVRETAALLALDPLLEEFARNLPHGRQRMLSIAIAFASRPEVLCLDEPLTGLSGPEVTQALDVVRAIRDDHGTSVFFVDHNMKAVMRICDRILVLHHGQLLAEGKPSEIVRDPQVIRAYLGGSV